MKIDPIPAEAFVFEGPAEPIKKIPLTTKLLNLAAVVLPFAGLVAAMIMLFGVAFSWVYLALMVGMYIVTVLGVSVGFHRLFTHRAFETPKPVAFILASIGSMAVEGPVLEWVAVHRQHHQHSDDENDPHSPHTHGAGVWAIIRGFFHAHLGWLFGHRTIDVDRYAPDLKKERVIRVASRLFPLWVAMGLLIPAVLGGLLTMSWLGVLLGLIWGGLVRVFLVHHVTWSINSVCHLWGTRPFESHDHSRNNPIFGVLAMGEGWHNNHHAFPTSARHGLRWWEFDASYLVIRFLALIGLAKNIRLPARERVAAKIRRS